MDAIFCQPDNEEHKKRRSSLKAALIKSLPKPDGLKTVTAITMARGTLLQLADYALLQCFCGSGGSGSAKLNMLHEMPVIYNIVLVVVQKVMNVTKKKAATAVSTSLKNTKNHSSARKYMEEKMRSLNNVREDTAEATSAHDDADAAESAGELSGDDDSDDSEYSAAAPESTSDGSSSAEPISDVPDEQSDVED